MRDHRRPLSLSRVLVRDREFLRRSRSRSRVLRRPRSRTRVWRQPRSRSRFSHQPRSRSRVRRQPKLRSWFSRQPRSRSRARSLDLPRNRDRRSWFAKCRAEGQVRTRKRNAAGSRFWEEGQFRQTENR